MIQTQRSAVGALTMAVLVGACSLVRSGEPLAVRAFDDGTFTSPTLPTITLHLPEEFRYLGATTFDLGREAHVDRHHFVDAGPTGEVERILILHFEGFLPGSGEVYRYRIPTGANAAGPDFRFTPRPVRLGDHDYIHNTWFFSARENVEANPDRELARSARLLSDRGYALPDEIRMSRFVRVVDEEARREFIIFYLEPLAPTGLRASEFVEGGAGAAVFEKLSAECTERSLAAFRVEAG